MTTSDTDAAPLPQRLYNRIWLLAALAMVFFAISYVAWGLLGIFSVPPG